MLWGGTCLALHSHDVLMDFVAGTEGGAVFRCVLAHSEAAEAAFSQVKGFPSEVTPRHLKQHTLCSIFINVHLLLLPACKSALHLSSA